MQLHNRFGEEVHQLGFPARKPACQFAKMLGRNPRCFSIIGLKHEGGVWVLRYRARKNSPWRPDERATWPRASQS